MKRNQRTQDIWYQLDNAANLFPAVSNDHNTNVYRLCCDLKEPIDKDTLQKALDSAIKSFPYFQVVMRRGLFWYYLERTNLTPTVQFESERPCGRLFYKNVKDLQMRVSYFQNRINLELFHAISDGTGAFDFLRAIVYNYILLAHGDSLPGDLPPLDREPTPTQQAADSFQHYYNPTKKDTPFKNKAFTIGGTLLPGNGIKVITATVPTKQMLALAKSKGVTATVYMAALMICAVYHELMPRRAAGKTIALTVPVDLRSHFSSETSRNFFSVVDVGYNFARQGGDFDQVLESITAQMKEKINPETLAGRISYTMSVQNNIFARFTPLVVKNFVLRVAYRRGERSTTGALSNLGRITMPEPFAGYIESFSCLLNPTHLHRFKACIASFQDNFTISFTSCIAETQAQKYFIRHLSSHGLDVCITCNGGFDDEIL